jgi:L-threonylcarbamoyladenylate synthase
MVDVLHGKDGVARAVQLLLEGECVALPTETVYGLAADASNDAAVAKIFSAKGRPNNHPLIVHIPSVEHLDIWATEVPAGARILASSCWPGPMTLLLKKSKQTSPIVTGGLDSVGLRVPSHPLFLEVLAAVNNGLAAPSANRYKALSPTSADQVVSGLDGRIAAVLDGGPCEFGLESTIVDFTTEVPRIVRAGPLSRQLLEERLGGTVEMPLEHDAIVPGNVKAHYQPRTQLRILSQGELTREALEIRESGFIIFSAEMRNKLAGIGVVSSAVYHLPADATGYAKALYASLHALDQLNLKTILLEKPPIDDDWSAVNDRLKRALGE